MRHHGFPPGHPRYRHKAVAPYCSIPAVNEPEPVSGNTIYIPIGFAARVRVYGRDDAGVDRESDAGAFESSDNGIFRVVSVTSVTPEGAAANYWEVLLAAVSIGTATLSEYVDAQADYTGNSATVPLTDSVTVVVYQVATEIVAYFTEEGAAELPVQYIGSPLFPFLQLPVNRNAMLRVEGRNGKLVVPLSNIVFDDGGSTHFHVVPTADPAVVTIVTDSVFIAGEPLIITADGDPSPSATSLSLEVSVRVVTEIPTILVAFYSVEPR